MALVFMILGPAFLGLGCAIGAQKMYVNTKYKLLIAFTALTLLVMSCIYFPMMGRHAAPVMPVIALNSFLFCTAIIAIYKAIFKKETGLRKNFLNFFCLFILAAAILFGLSDLLSIIFE